MDSTNTTPDTPVAAAYQRLDNYRRAHAYQRGQFKGDGPLDASSRRRSHERVVAGSRGGRPFMGIHRYTTTMIRVFEDGRLLLDCNGWAGSSTTKVAFNMGLHRAGIRAHLSSAAKFGLNQLTLTMYTSAGAKTYIYYDGMEFDAQGQLISEPKPFKRKQVNRGETTAFTQGMADSGFKDLFKLLHATCTEEDMPMNTRAFTSAVAVAADTYTDPDCADRWKDCVAAFAFDVSVSWDFKTGTTLRTCEKRDAAMTWARITRACKKDMVETVDTDVFVI